MSHRPIPAPGASTGTTSYRAGSGDLDWQEQAACRGADRELFFASDDERGNATKQREAEAKAVCAGCPVKAQCLQDALKGGLEGIWGGTNDAERRSIKRKGAKAAAEAQPANSSASWKIGQDAASAARATQAELDRAALIADIEHLAGAGADVHAAARAAGKTVGALEKALQRAQQNDLLARLKRAS